MQLPASAPCDDVMCVTQSLLTIYFVYIYIFNCSIHRSRLNMMSGFFHSCKYIVHYFFRKVGRLIQPFHIDIIERIKTQHFYFSSWAAFSSFNHEPKPRLRFAKQKEKNPLTVCFSISTANNWMLVSLKCHVSAGKYWCVIPDDDTDTSEQQANNSLPRSGWRR